MKDIYRCPAMAGASICPKVLFNPFICLKGEYLRFVMET
jgi:hypothetical protein